MDRFGVGDRVIERRGEDRSTAVIVETVIVEARAGHVRTRDGHWYDALTGGRVDRGQPYRSITSPSYYRHAPLA